MPKNRQPDRFKDTEGIVHMKGPFIAVNLAVCANNDQDGEFDCEDPVNCHVCIAIVEHVAKWKGKL